MSLCFRDLFTHTWCSTVLSQNSYRGQSPLKMRQGGYITLHRDECTAAWEGVWEGPVNIAPLHHFTFQLRFLLTKQTWLLYHSNSFVASNSFSHSFSCCPLPSPLLPTILYYLYGKKIFELLLAKCDINSFLFSDVQQELGLPKRLLVLKPQDY